MLSNRLLDLAIKKIDNGELTLDDITHQEYKTKIKEIKDKELKDKA